MVLLNMVLLLSLIEKLAYFPKFQKAKRHPQKNLVAHCLITTVLQRTFKNDFQYGCKHMYPSAPHLIWTSEDAKLWQIVKRD